MRKYTIIKLIALTFLFAGCVQADQKKIAPAEGKNHKIVKHFTCTMHPGIITDKPGLCPKCGMELVEKDN
jgi:Cu(I)/Ag(I) efflux system membrane fusion protein